MSGTLWSEMSGTLSTEIGGTLCPKYSPRPRKEKKLPKILSKQDVANIINCATGFRNFTLLGFLYGTGMRLAEVAAVKIEDIDGKRLQVRVNQGKGGKDRFVKIPSSLLEILRAYYKAIRPNIYLFVGEQNGKPSCRISQLLKPYKH